MFFYGVKLQRKDGRLDKSYQADALSANTRLNVTHFQDFHVYRLEWEPAQPDYNGTLLDENDHSDGYMRWYVDDKFVYGIRGHSLNITGSRVPYEPM